MSAWVEPDEQPPPSTRYEVVDGQVVVPAGAADRRGIQPVVTLTVEGGERADAGVGDEVVLRAHTEVPAGTGRIVSVEWDLDGSGSFRERAGSRSPRRPPSSVRSRSPAAVRTSPQCASPPSGRATSVRRSPGSATSLVCAWS